VADVGEEEAFVDGDVGGVLAGGVNGALVGILFPTHVDITTLPLVVPLLLLYPLLVIVPIIVTPRDPQTPQNATKLHI
jgi:hypothetical protein